MDSKIFEVVILFTIFVNTIFLGVDAATFPSNSTNDTVQSTADFIFVAIFTAEMLLKIMAWGVFFNGPYSYFRDYWNWLDFLVTVTCYFVFISSQFTVFKLLRLIRPLRAIAIVPRMRILAQSLLLALPSLFDVALLFCFVVFMFGLMGVQLYNGRFEQNTKQNNK